MDYISVNLTGEVMDTPSRQNENMYSFELKNELKKGKSNYFLVMVRDKEPIDINKGDHVNIFNAGFFVKEDVNVLAVLENSRITVSRIRCNLGEEEV